MINAILSFYSPKFPTTLAYMLQSTEYRVGPYLKWFWRTQNFSKVEQRRQLELTKAARLLTLAIQIGIVLEVLLGLVFIALNLWHNFAGGWEFGLAIIIAYPVAIAHLITLPLLLGRELSVKPKEQKLITQSSKIFKRFKGTKIAVAGSYGKTSMKELLLTVLGEAKRVAATPSNKNVSVSHAHFAKSLSGKEEILIIEYGEGAPGDVERFADITHPTHGVITGLAPAHLDRYKTIEAAGKDIFILAKYLKNKNVYVNSESPSAESFLQKEYHLYNREGALGWAVSNIKVSIDGTRFDIQKGKRELKLHSKLLGRHQVGSLALAVALAVEFGLNDQQIIAGVAKTVPFEHRMQPYQLSGAWIIDDTYNGNIEGIRAGTELLKDLSAQRKIYVTPGLVDQGKETETVHIKMGKLIGASQPNLVVLMQNSVTKFIRQGLEATDFKGEIQIEKKPLEFYANLGEFLAVGDVVMMQNDWTDNYA